MKKNQVTVSNLATTFITGITLAALLQAGISFAENNHQEVKNGSIRIQQEEFEFPALAKITMEQAKDIALANVQGEVLKIELENENGFLIYGVEVVSPERMTTDIKIDAGSGEILLVELDTPDDDQYRNDHHDTDREDDDSMGDDRD